MKGRHEVTAEEILDKLLEARGYKSELEKQIFLNPNYDDHLHDPFTLPDMDKAVSRIKIAIEKGEKIFIYGDYDVDGLTATALLSDVLSQLGIECGQYLPNRFTEGYGLSKAGMDSIHKQGGKLIITVDCGSLSFKEADYAKSLGIDLIVTDHHSIKPELPEAIAVINPKRKDSKYAFEDLAGVGVAFKLVQALQKKLGKPKSGQEKWLLDLVALGTICDIVPLHGENRVLAKWGIEVLKKTKRPGLTELAKVSGVELEDINEFDVGFKFGPRLNAAGRVDTAQDGLDLLMATSSAEASRLAKKLNAANQRRQATQEMIFKAADEQAAKFSSDPVLLLASEDWSHGIVGIVASKIMEKHQKPTFVAQIMGSKTKGSGRSFGKFRLDDAINSIREDLITGGGHAFAAGLSFDTEKLEKIRKSLNELYKKEANKKTLDHFKVLEDMLLSSQIDLSIELAGHLDKLRPYGQGNKQPVFAIRKVSVVESRLIGKDSKHVKLKVKHGSSVVDCIGFNMADKMQLVGNDFIDIKGNFEINRFNGRLYPQIRLLDIA